MCGAEIELFIGPMGERLAGCMLLRCFITECVWSSSRTYIWQVVDRLMDARSHWQTCGFALNVLLHMQM